jgi:hypothetical protein
MPHAGPACCRVGNPADGAGGHRLPSDARRPDPAPPCARGALRSVRVVESRGDAAVSLPDLLGQAGELFQVLLAVLHLLLPPRRVDREDRLEVLRRGGDAVEVEFAGCRDDPDRRLPAADLAVGEPQQPQQRPQVVTVTGP